MPQFAQQDRATLSELLLNLLQLLPACACEIVMRLTVNVTFRVLSTDVRKT